MKTSPTYVLVGAGMAGAHAADTLRAEGFDGRVVLLGQERERPYERPPLSKEYLLGESETNDVYVHGERWYADNDVDLRLGVRAAAVHRSRHEVELDDGERLRYDKLLLATGASPRRLRAPGADLDGVHYLRTVGDSERLRNALRMSGKVCVVGGGWIGLETAAAARGYGADVVVLEPQPTPLHGVLGPELGEVFAGLHRQHGVEVRTDTGAVEFRGDDATGGKVTGVLTTAGDTVEADTVIVAIGVSADIELATDAGLAVDNGVLADSSLRAGDPDIYVAGDVANAYNPLLGQRIRVEHWANAKNQGPVAARGMLGQDASYDEAPYFFTDQYDLGMEFSGQLNGYDEVVYRGDVDSLEFVVFWLIGGRVVAGMNVNVWDVADDIARMVRTGDQVDRRALADPAEPLGRFG